MNMTTEQNKTETTDTKTVQADPQALKKEIARAMEMMKRVKKANNIPSEAIGERQPTYFIPEEIVLCQTSC